MKRIQLAAMLVALSATTAGCVTVAPRVAKDAPLAPASGYVGGIFSKATFVGFGFGVVNQETQAEYVLAIEDKDVGLIAVPPGSYRVAYWETWSLTRERLTKKELSASSPLGRRFEVGAGKVVLVGKWSADRELGLGSNTFTIVPQKVSASQAVEAFRASYPGFAAAPVGCLTCTP